ncbi:MAG: nicotinate phosphoribosyltransferase [Akkermansiaceae bacterium]|jgi:nicotinate phosphoribosyltransferase|nr:nicotinate phosphoribosyltransferase [Akkermansiaceae bacterium]
MNTNNPLLTDLYQITMAAAYHASGRAEQEAAFHLFFRTLPFKGGYAIAAGLGSAVEWLESFHFEADDIEYLATLRDAENAPLLKPEFLAYLRDLKLSVCIDALPEGTLVFPHQPILRINGPIIQCQLLETALLNIINFQTLIATKAARVCEAAQGEPVIEMGLRRAQGPDGALAASRAAHIGGCATTSNVLAGKIYGIPVKGTHAHSWVMSFETEIEAFQQYAAALPGNCTFLVDTYDTLEGVRNAVKVGNALRETGHRLLGIRLDSGDLAWLSQQARIILDEAGFTDTAIVASNDLDENLIESLKHQGAKISVWGVGTKLVTGGEQSALGGVYKLAAVRDEAGQWQPRIKLSEQVIKVSTPGLQQVRRFKQNGLFIADAIYDAELPCPEPCTIVDPSELLRHTTIEAGTGYEDLLQPLFRDGKLVAALPTIAESRSRCLAQLASLSPTIKRLANPHNYPAGLEAGLHQKKLALIQKARP